MTPKPRSPAKAGKPALVRTTLLIEEDLWREAKTAALEDRKALRDLLIEGLKLVLARRRGGRS